MTSMKQILRAFLFLFLLTAADNAAMADEAGRTLERECAAHSDTQK